MGLSWIGQFLTWFINWIPQPQLIQSNERAVRFGPWRTKLLPGPCCAWEIPNTQSISSTSVALQYLSLRAQALTTLDAQSVTAAATVAFEVTDPWKYLVEVEDALDGVADVAGIAMKQAVTSGTFETIRAEAQDVDRKMLQKVRSLLEPFGVKVRYLRITSFAKTQVLNVQGSNHTIVIPPPPPEN